MGKLKKVDLRLRKAGGTPVCLASGFIAMDIVEGELETFLAAGGSCGNVIALLSYMGWNAKPVARLGTDHAGSFIRTQFENLGVDTSHVSNVPLVQTPIVVQRFVKSRNGECTHRFSLTCPDCGAWLPRYRPTTLKHASEVIEKNSVPDIFFFDRTSPCALRLAGWARERRALVFFEPSSIGDERQFQRAVDSAHILKYSYDRLGHLPDLAKVNGPKIVIETHGADGLRVRWRSRWSSLPAIKASRFVDAAGSGDWCTAGVIHAIGQGGSKILETIKKNRLDYALRLGQALASINCGFEGARGAMRKLDIDGLNFLMSNSKEDARALESFDRCTDGALPADLCLSCSPPLPDSGANSQRESKTA